MPNFTSFFLTTVGNKNYIFLLYILTSSVAVVSVSPASRPNGETEPSRLGEGVEHWVKGAVARPDNTGCPTVELELK